MRLARIVSAPGRFARKVGEVGVREAVRHALIRAAGVRTHLDALPLEHADQTALFAVDTTGIRAREKQQMRATSLLHEASHVESTYPRIYERDGRILRYAFLPAARQARGLVVLFHGHNAFLHLGPMFQWRDFDVLAPWDTFGWRRQGSWFWGEKGDDFVDGLVAGLLAEQRAAAPDRPWFATGGSMGGFAALYHGIKYGCAGIYVSCPQVDLRAKIVEYGLDDQNNPYGYLRAATLESAPDLLALAEAQESLPPLFLVQHQYDPVNPFADHGFRLLEIYNRKQAWYGVRVHPAIGHGGDGSQQEAELFFNLVLEKAPPRRVEFRTPVTAHAAPGA